MNTNQSAKPLWLVFSLSNSWIIVSSFVTLPSSQNQPLSAFVKGCQYILLARLIHIACSFTVELPEEPIAEKNASPAVIGKALEKEARAILAAVPKGSGLAALCVEGKQKTSEELAAYLDERAGSGAGDVAFVIGSSHGLADSVKQTASLRLSMSKMTFPHQLARVMLLEQLYRAFSINHGGKYHK